MKRRIPLWILRFPAGYAAAVAGILSLAVYFPTMSPTVGIIDSGELAAVACTLGIAHPTGYPLFTLLGSMISMLPIGGEEIVRLNAMAAIVTSLSVSCFVLLSLGVTRTLLPGKEWTIWAERGPSPVAIAASVGASLLLGFSETVWTQALGVEVYSLHLLLVMMTLTMFLSVVAGQKGEPHATKAGWPLVAFLLGLSFTNHMTTVLLIPGMLVFYLSRYGVKKESLYHLGRMIPFFLLGLSLYLYLPVRASHAPLFSWGDVTSAERFLWHVTGKQYRVWLFSSSEVAGRQLVYFWESLPGAFGYAGLFLAALGIPVLWRRARKMFVFTTVLFLTCVSYSVNYDIHDIDSYFLLAYVVLAVWAGCGLYTLLTWLERRTRVPRLAVFALSLAAPLISCLHHYGDVDQSEDFMVEDYTMNMFASLDSNAIVLSYQWDYWVSASYYYQAVKDVRPDLTVIDKELLRRSWYLTELERRYPWLIEESRTEVEAFREQLFRFEHDLPYDPRIIQARFEEMIAGFVGRSMTHRPSYVTPEIEPEFTRGLQRVPAGLALRLHADTLFHPTPFPDLSYRPSKGNGKHSSAIKSLYARALVARGDYYARRGRHEEALRAYEAARNHDPSILGVSGRFGSSRPG
jgi:tetratricopeptide (TPR) repeat protein